MKVKQTITAQWFSNDQFGKRSYFMLMNQEHGKSTFNLLLKLASVNMAEIEQIKDEVINKLFLTQTHEEYLEVFKSEIAKVNLILYVSSIVEVSCPGFEKLRNQVKCLANEFMSNYERSFQRQADSAKLLILKKLQDDFEQEVFGSSFSI